MKAIQKFLSLCIALTLLLSGPMGSVSAARTDIAQAQSEENDGMPGWPMPANPIPFTEVGRVSKAGGYSTTVQTQQPVLDPKTGEPTDQMTIKDVTLTGVDALAADYGSAGPLVGNYSLVNWDSILLSTHASDGSYDFMPTYKVAGNPPQLTTISDPPIGDINGTRVVTAADFNNDNQDEQIAAYVGTGNQIFLSVGENQATLGRATSDPMLSMRASGGGMDLFVRGYDETLWHRYYNGSSWGAWDNAGGGLLLSAPAIASVGNGTFTAFALGSDNCTYRRYFNGSTWAGADWTRMEASSTECIPLDFWAGSTPEMPAPAAVARGAGIDLFRLGSDNTLRWNHSSNGSTLDGWQSLGGMLASGPAAVSSGASDIKVFARGADGALWFRVYNGSWGAWQRAELTGVDEGVTFNYAPAVGSDLKVYLLGSDQQIWKSQCSSTSCGTWSPSGVPSDLTDPLVSNVAIGSGSMSFIARSQAGNLKYSGDGVAWGYVDGLPKSIDFPTGITATRLNGAYIEGSISTKAGHFLGNGRPQLALAYYSSSGNVTVQAYKTEGGFKPVSLSSLPISHPNVAWFRMDTGNFLPNENGIDDGIDEIALAYMDTDWHTYRLDILQFSGSTLNVAFTGTLDTLADYAFAALNIAAGDFNGDGQDEIAMTRLDYLNLPLPNTYILSTRLSVHQVTGPNGSHTLNSFAIDSAANQMNWTTVPWRNGIVLAAGDMDNDGKDEIVRTWPDFASQLTPYLKRNLEVLTLPTTWAGAAITPEKKITVDNTKNESNSSALDILAVGDLNRDFKNEIVWLFNRAAVLNGLATYEYGESGYETLAQIDYLLMDQYVNPSLVVGNFTREGIRVGQPTYHLQNSVETLVAMVNMPPKHLDYVKDDATGLYHLIKTPIEDCDASQDPSCTHAKYQTEAGQESSQVVTAKRGSSFSEGVEASACAGVDVSVASVKACANASLTDTYGEDFEKTNTQIVGKTFTKSVLASTDDKIAYYGIQYKVWEYPVLSENSDKEATFFTVAFPAEAPTPEPTLASGYNNGFCDETWFHVGHQINNVWSYDPIGDIRFPDYVPTPGNLISNSAVTDGEASHLRFDGTNNSTTSMQVNHEIADSVGAEVSASVNISVVEVSADVKASMSGNYADSALNTDTFQTSSSTEYSYYFSDQPADIKYAVNVIAYWAKGGYQVINYQTQPGNVVGWNLYNKPDPAFILPWYGFPDPDNFKRPPCGSQKKLYSPDIVIEKQGYPVSSVELGDQVTLKATVRNFSDITADNVTVRFYLGYPGTGNEIGTYTINTLARPQGPKTASINWTVSGATGKQNIYVVLDPDNSLAEVHDDDDEINNNIGYGLLDVSASAFFDMGDAQKQPYDALTYQMPTGGTEPTVAFYMPRASQKATTRFELKDYGSNLPVAGRVFELAAYQVAGGHGWEPIPSFNLTSEANKPVSLISLDYAGTGYSDNLKLWRHLSNGSWTVATCSGYEDVSFPANDVLVVPVCETGVFAFSEISPADLDITPPTVQSVTAVDPNPTDLLSVELTVKFSEAVDGVDMVGPDFADFVLTSSLFKPSITAVSGAGDTYTVTVNTGSGSGTLHLDVSTGGNIVDTFGNPLDVGFTTGETYNITKPAVFADAPNGYWAKNFIEHLYFNQITGGCGGTPLNYCPDANVNRAMMAVFVLRAAHGSDFVPPAATGLVFTDVPADGFAAAWIEELASEGITGGCGGGKYCPNAPVTRAQMAVFLVKALYGVDYVPPAATGTIFADVPADGFAAAFIEKLVADGITGGCGGGNYCPNAYINRAQMAVFLVAAFDLP